MNYNNNSNSNINNVCFNNNNNNVINNNNNFLNNSNPNNYLNNIFSNNASNIFNNNNNNTNNNNNNNNTNNNNYAFNNNNLYTFNNKFNNNFNNFNNNNTFNTFNNFNNTNSNINNCNSNNTLKANKGSIFLFPCEKSEKLDERAFGKNQTNNSEQLTSVFFSENALRNNSNNFLSLITNIKSEEFKKSNSNTNISISNNSTGKSITNNKNTKVINNITNNTNNTINSTEVKTDHSSNIQRIESSSTNPNSDNTTTTKKNIFEIKKVHKESKIIEKLKQRLIIPYLKKFNPKTIKREEIDKKIIRKFRKYIKTKIQLRKFNEYHPGFQFWRKFTSKSLMPPMVIEEEQLEFKSFNWNFLVWVVSRTGFTELFSQFLKERKSSLLRQIRNKMKSDKDGNEGESIIEAEFNQIREYLDKYCEIYQFDNITTYDLAEAVERKKTNHTKNASKCKTECKSEGNSESNSDIKSKSIGDTKKLVTNKQNEKVEEKSSDFINNHIPGVVCLDKQSSNKSINNNFNDISYFLNLNRQDTVKTVKTIKSGINEVFEFKINNYNNLNNNNFLNNLNNFTNKDTKTPCKYMLDNLDLFKTLRSDLTERSGKSDLNSRHYRSFINFDNFI